MTGIEDSLNGYCSSYEKIANDICESIDEGFNEGLREGIKQGFIEGVKECRNTGFDNIEVKKMEEILKCAFRTASDETCSTAKQAISNSYLAKIAPSFKQKMGQACNKAVEEIKDADFELDKKSAFCTKSCVDASVKKITVCIGNVCGDMRKKFSTDVTFGSFFDRLQDVFNSELEKNLKACEERICKEIDSKVNNKRLDHERH
ncbi:MAG: hypothetical protein PHF18_06090 [Methanosarcina sp.]|uniref:hypothetical protein n=1 Tax=Methanosarcina sp. TaxID=2213 RepID=UPI0026226BA8|nr:hypothetical protein [Methanosarcina sp.]MDD3246409.1 hypothetical protein [Methanosarcina sp.]MDD4249341.1 hypothetical protein [Methanosarcina sp.]